LAEAKLFLFLHPATYPVGKIKEVKLNGDKKREERKVYKVLVESLKEKDHSEGQGADGRMGSEWI
jgi:hypothetical protein